MMNLTGKEKLRRKALFGKNPHHFVIKSTSTMMGISKIIAEENIKRTVWKNHACRLFCIGSAVVQFSPT